MDDVNLVDAVTEAMVTVGLEPKNIEYITNLPRFKAVRDLENSKQVSELVMVFYDLFLTLPEIVPRETRVALSLAKSPRDWIVDFTNGVLKFIKVNEAVIFAHVE